MDEVSSRGINEYSSNYFDIYSFTRFEDIECNIVLSKSSINNPFLCFMSFFLNYSA